MTYRAAHPELDQLVPRQVKIRPRFMGGILFLFLMFLILTPLAVISKRVLFSGLYSPSLLLGNRMCLYLMLAAMFFMPVFILGTVINFLRQYFKEKNLLIWGNVAEAKTSEGPAYSPGKGCNVMDIRYEFKDADGNLIEGVKNKFPARDGSGWRQEENIQQLEHPVVLYDPKDSSINMLYPSLNAYCVARK